MTNREQDIVIDTQMDFSQKQVQRALFAGQCEEIAELIWPEQMNTFYYGNYNFQGQKRTQRQVDATGMRALHKAVAITDSMLTPQHMVWHHLGPDHMLRSKHTVGDG